MSASHPHPEERRLLTVARELAEQAAEEVQKRLGLEQTVERKADHSPVTEADRVSDQLIREGLAKVFPHHAILTEETGLAGDKSATWTWCVDPLDGTKAFAKQIPGFCVMVGLFKEGRPHLGVVVDPMEGHAYEAVRGMGAFHSFRGKVERLHVSTRSILSEMPLVISTGFPVAELDKIRASLNGPLQGPINSVGIKVGLLVRQIGDIYLNHHSVHFWDTCAPQVILEEAGGTFSRWDGTALSYDLSGDFSHHSKTLASNGTCHEELVRILEKIP